MTTKGLYKLEDNLIHIPIDPKFENKTLKQNMEIYKNYWYFVLDHITNNILIPSNKNEIGISMNIGTKLVEEFIKRGNNKEKDKKVHYQDKIILWDMLYNLSYYIIIDLFFPNNLFLMDLKSIIPYNSNVPSIVHSYYRMILKFFLNNTNELLPESLDSQIEWIPDVMGRINIIYIIVNDIKYSFKIFINKVHKVMREILYLFSGSIHVDTLNHNTNIIDKKIESQLIKEVNEFLEIMNKKNPENNSTNKQILSNCLAVLTYFLFNNGLLPPFLDISKILKIFNV